ncbi:MAG: hypothetical protein HUU09_16040, partial [Candidatus Jettenia caeni]|nr:hypothetical protein [Candidatus Jettenia caeni]
MFFNAKYKNLFIYLIILAPFTSFLSSVRSSSALAHDNFYVGLARIIKTSRFNILNPDGMIFCSKSKTFFVVEAPLSAQSSHNITMITSTEELVGSLPIATRITDPINMTFDDKANRLLIFQSDTKTLVKIKAGSDGYLNPDTITEFDAQKFGLQNPQGMTVDPAHGHLFILDSAVPEIVHIRPHPCRDFHNAKISRIHLEQIEKSDLQGIAFNPANGHLYSLNFREQALYEFTREGKIVTTYPVSEFELRNPRSIVFAPSGDQTDDPSKTCLYIADRNHDTKEDRKTELFEDMQKYTDKEKDGQGYGKIIEFSFTQPALIAATNTTSLIRTIDTSKFSPPGPDPSGIIYLPFSNRLLIADGEVDEVRAFADVNLFEMSLTGNLLDTLSTISFSNEPTGITMNPDNRHLFIADDAERKIFELDPGPDEKYNTSDDRLTFFDTRPFGSTDPEGIAYDTSQGVLFIADGLNREV